MDRAARPGCKLRPRTPRRRAIMIRVPIAVLCRVVPVDRRRIRRAVTLVLSEAGYETGEISVAVVDDAEMRALHERYLNDDSSTDVLSFPLEVENNHIEGEIVVCAETAARQGPRFGRPPEHELILYVVHGALHLAGYDDVAPRDRTVMRRRQDEYLERLGLGSG
ncbi:hypothetical protein JCM17478_27560 [Thermopirellula anaerolimosa]